jgi:hypothetical protein
MMQRTALTACKPWPETCAAARVERLVADAMQSEAARDRENVPESRALVRAPAPSAERQTAAPRALAPFVAQLFACEAKLESFRRRRRAGPERATASYEASGQLASASVVRLERVL